MDMPLLLTPNIHEDVVRDGLPRVGAYDDGSQHVLYLDGEVVRSMLATAWPSPLPTEPTPAESETAIAARETAREGRKAAALLRRQGMLALAESAVGVKVGALTPRQVEALLGVVLLNAGALDDELKIRPIEDWAE
jgi:hypothetical protein